MYICVFFVCICIFYILINKSESIVWQTLSQNPSSVRRIYEFMALREGWASFHNVHNILTHWTNRLVFNDNYSFKRGSNGCANLFHVVVVVFFCVSSGGWFSKWNCFNNIYNMWNLLCMVFFSLLLIDQDHLPTMLVQPKYVYKGYVFEVLFISHISIIILEWFSHLHINLEYFDFEMLFNQRQKLFCRCQSNQNIWFREMEISLQSLCHDFHNDLRILVFDIEPNISK